LEAPILPAGRQSPVVVPLPPLLLFLCPFESIKITHPIILGQILARRERIFMLDANGRLLVWPSGAKTGRAGWKLASSVALGSVCVKSSGSKLGSIACKTRSPLLRQHILPRVTPPTVARCAAWGSCSALHRLGQCTGAASINPLAFNGKFERQAKKDT